MMNEKFKTELENAMDVSAILIRIPAYVELMKNVKTYTIENGIEYEGYLGSVKTTVIRNDSINDLNNEIKYDSNGNLIIKLVDQFLTTISIFDSIEGFWLMDSYVSLCVLPNESNFKTFLKNLDIYINKEVK